MVWKILRIVAAVGLGGAVAGSFAITGYLSRLEGGLTQDIQAVDRIVVAERAVQAQNQLLDDMVTVTGSVGSGLDGILATTEALHGSVVAVGQANRGTLALNEPLIANNAEAAQQLQQVVESLKAMNQSSAEIRDYMSQLRDTAAADVKALKTVAYYSGRMNAKTPGW